MARDDVEVTGANFPDCLQDLARCDAVLKTTGELCLELICRLAAFTLALTFEKVPCMCPWDSAFGAELVVTPNCEIHVRLDKDNGLSFVHLGLPCQIMIWARSPPVRSWVSIRCKGGLAGLALDRVQAGNQLLLFTQLCVVLYEAGCYFSVENPELCWTSAFAVVAFVRNLPGVAVVEVHCVQYGTRFSNPTLFLHNLPCLHSLADLSEAKGWRTKFPEGPLLVQRRIPIHHRFITSLVSPYPPKLASLFASLARNSLVKRAVDCGV